VATVTGADAGTGPRRAVPPMKRQPGHVDQVPVRCGSPYVPDALPGQVWSWKARRRSVRSARAPAPG